MRETTVETVLADTKKRKSQKRTSPRFRDSFWITRNFLVGMPHQQWRRLTTMNKVDAAFAGRAAVLGLLSRFNSVAAKRESARFGAAIAATEIHPSPIFLLGHWRSGTTHLHQLLGLDPQLGFVTSLQAIHPLTSLVTGAIFTKRSARKRPMDNVRVGSFSPQEDEFAIATHSLASLNFGYVFPRSSRFYDRYLTLDDVTPAEMADWRNALIWTLKKATFLAGGRRLVIKSPTHTGRVRLLRELFPSAKFVHIHRAPQDVFRSQLALNDLIGWNSYLQVPNEEDLVNDALRRYRLMFTAYSRDVETIPASQFCEISYRDLTREPLAVVKSVYRDLEIPGFDRFEPVLAGHLAASSSYERSTYDELTPELKHRIDEIASPWSAQWGY